MKNISDKELTLKQMKVLAKSLNFAVSQDIILTQDLVIATERACLFVSGLGEREQTRTEVTSFLKKAIPHTSNITKEERRPLNELHTDKEITILPADKGKAAMMTNVSTYNKKIGSMLIGEKPGK